MKTKHYSLRSMAITALLATAILPQSLEAQNFTPDLFPGQSPHREDYEIEATVNVGDFGQATNMHSWVQNLTSTNQDVVRTYNQNGYTAVLIVGCGEADVTYTETYFTTESGGGGAEGGAAGGDGQTSGDVTNHIIHYKVIKGVPVAQYTGREGVVSSARLIWDGNPDHGYTFNPPNLEIYVQEVYLEQNTFPKFRNKYIYAQQCELVSTNEAVATVNARGVTPKSYGKTTIRATWPGDDNWMPATCEYELTVEAPKNNVYINFYQNSVTGFVGESMSALMNMSMLNIDNWYSENPEIASVNATTGQVQFLKEGTTQIFAEIYETDDHYAAIGSYSVTVKKRNPNLSFDKTEVYAELNVPFTPPTLKNDYNVTISKWYSSDTKVADVNESTGELNIKGLGKTIISCEFTGNDIYEGSIASYTLHVTATGITVMGITVNSLNADDVLGDGQKKVTYNTDTRTLILNEWTVDVAGMDPAIRQGVIQYQGESSLIINPIGENSILNADVCIFSETGAVLIKSTTKDSKLTLLANEKDMSIAIQALALKVHGCELNATGAIAAMKLGHELTVSKGCHIYAESTGENSFAIQCNSFNLADEGIEILTPGVHYFEKYCHFFDDEANTVLSKVVEIGKKPVTIPEDEETVIQFNVTDPEDNDAVVFSTSADDKFNEETGQLEISTTLTDEQVANALETLIPGSSAWMALLPGSLVFDIPAGKGTIKINCLTLPGYTLNINIQGHGVVSISQAEFGWALVNYDVAEPTHVVIYLHASSSSARADRRAPENPNANAFISAIAITPEGVPTVIEVNTATANNNEGNAWYDLQGRRLNAKPATKGIYVKDGTKVVIK